MRHYFIPITKTIECENDVTLNENCVTLFINKRINFESCDNAFTT